MDENITPYKRLAANFPPSTGWGYIIKGCEQLERENHPLGIELSKAFRKIHGGGRCAFPNAIEGAINGWRLKSDNGYVPPECLRRQSPTYQETDYTPIIDAVKRLDEKERAFWQAKIDKRKAAAARRKGGYTRLYIHPDTIEAVNKLLSGGKLVVTDGILSLSAR